MRVKAKLFEMRIPVARGGFSFHWSKNIKKYLTRIYGDKKIIATKVHEVCGHLCIHGDHVSRVKEWLLKKGL